MKIAPQRRNTTEKAAETQNTTPSLPTWDSRCSSINTPFRNRPAFDKNINIIRQHKVYCNNRHQIIRRATSPLPGLLPTYFYNFVTLFGPAEPVDRSRIGRTYRAQRGGRHLPANDRTVLPGSLPAPFTEFARWVPASQPGSSGTRAGPGESYSGSRWIHSRRWRSGPPRRVSGGCGRRFASRRSGLPRS